ncbi:hypothetical protein LT330_007443 [Penicillium expansum]|uniref:Uncharacterized protein n=1 Tax=Penicillium expansum TaxID=27334 RepID=A0A0A2K5C2_PENEN|nr:hypothetical protein PEX2_044900 [Penicillium expansum]KAK4868245.1 hypothetical protein LT330_007443 [Penicillium expansum]KGO47364.1 hypothetical protein PEXP_081630 [Penicillium expansum]KGO62967.1 hypothetical protein PEX2_044900 [Penicillium expansum]KGO67193.1 hypothetical protein PEX1_014340 [Penicillium expansum]
MCPPLWVWLFGQKEHSLRKLYKNLRYMQPGYISNQCCNIDIHPMDFWTGDTDPSLVQFFTPDTDTDLKIANTALNPKNPVDDPFTRAQAMKHAQDFIPQEMHHKLHQAFSKYLRKSPGGTPIFWDLVSMEEDESLFNSNDKHGFTIQMGATSADGKTAHQLVVMESDNCYHGILPSVGELMVLVRWMLSGIKNHKHQFRRYHRQERAQHDFPTMVISFLPDARVRVLHGYFDDGRLKVAYTQALNFDAEDYTDKMDTLLQWAWPLTDGDTTKPIPLPTIDDDEEDEWDEWEKWELRYREDNEDEFLGSKSDESDSTEADEDLSDCESEFEEEVESDWEDDEGPSPTVEWGDDEWREEEELVMSADIKRKIMERLDEKLRGLGKL